MICDGEKLKVFLLGECDIFVEGAIGIGGYVSMYVHIGKYFHIHSPYGWISANVCEGLFHVLSFNDFDGFIELYAIGIAFGDDAGGEAEFGGFGDAFFDEIDVAELACEADFADCHDVMRERDIAEG